ncbi:hypothetical protein P154DRAFT_569511 [Amniculicola lignicola CBS 123094]|uniref:Uncharacterized protein n=1 Tax=Amniculicola lignicola CBS 123094 TaxID=1392246 RepID=A0A6A5X2W9_9PLEO|nr:hypothetical protein P154DRAFT_569511 [Amniculicola lignicola CBS 123094]
MMISSFSIASTVVIGQSYNITWVAWLKEGEQPVPGSIGLHVPFTEFGATEFNITEMVTESPYLWTIPRNLESGEEYQLLWMSTDRPEDGVYGGPSFNVTDILLLNVPSATPSASVSAPESTAGLPVTSMLSGATSVSTLLSSPSFAPPAATSPSAATASSPSSPGFTSTDRPTNSSKSGFGPGSIAGIVIGAFLGACVLAFAAFLLGRRRYQRQTPVENAQQQKTVEGEELPWNKCELDGTDAKAEMDGSGTFSTDGSMAELDSKNLQELPHNEAPQELPHFNQAPQELPGDLPEYRQKP